ncbi:hypothetical protein GOP47_0012292 [Adiantum capillus-veneris]|uniref:trans-cinnamate 4-monooxygenase n=1 Tax=Adiantum capillus-veneris TaxID=13818 RepID=A0A9D4UQN0_ADICA|nr:hypothetical protein GOP47_0012292 [Adiantum capillus-veneris]
MDSHNNVSIEAAPFINFSASSLISTSLVALVGALLLAKVVQKLRLKLPPGPFAWPIVGNFLQLRTGLTPQTLAAVAKKYGDVCLLQMGQRKVLVISSPAMAKEVLQTQGVEFGSRARNLVFDMTTGHGQDFVFADYGEHWRKMRRIATLPFFTNKVVQQSRLAWEQEIGQAISEITAMPESTTSGIIIRDRLQLMIQSFKYNYGDFVPSFKPFLRGYLKDVWAANQRRLVFLQDAFLNERRKQTGQKIGVDFFLDAYLKGEISESSVLYLVQNMNVAAIDTTLWSTEWGVAELVNNPRIQRKIIDELDNVLGKGVPLTEPDLPRLPYLQAMVKEILRVHMVVPLLLPHMNLEAAKLAGYDIPAGCRVLVNAWGIANDPRYWDKPEEFNPDRFLDNNVELNGNDFRFIPFGSGRRSCPGSIIALPLLGLVLGKLLQAFEILPPPGDNKVDLSSVGSQLGLTIAKRSRVVMKPRGM